MATLTPSPAERLARALARYPRGDLASPLRDALRDATPGDPGGHAIIADPTGQAARILGEAYPQWSASGWREVRVKPHQLSVTACEVMDGVLNALRLAGCPLLVPHWLTPTAMLALNLPDAVDLRAIARSSVPDARAVPATCLAFLDSVAAAGREVADAMRRAGGPPMIPFPVGPRYAAARARLARLAGSDVAARLPATVDDDAASRVLFCDPKPANLVLAEAQIARWRATASPRPVGVDLDLACYESSYALQAVLATFSAPLPEAGTGEEELAHRYRQLQEASARFGANPAQVDALLLYHLVRNFTHAVDQGDRAKAMAFGEAICGVSVLLRLGFGHAERRCVRAAAASAAAPHGPAG